MKKKPTQKPKKTSKRLDRGIDIQDPDTGYNTVESSFNRWLCDFGTFIKRDKK